MEVDDFYSQNSVSEIIAAHLKMVLLSFEKYYPKYEDSRHAGWGGSGWIDLSCPLQSVCQRHVPTLAPRRVSPLGGRHGHLSHVPQADTARQLPGVISQRRSTVVECMENRH